MSRNESFNEGRTPLEDYLSFAERRPEQATAREVFHSTIPADLGLMEDKNGKYYRPFGPHNDTPQAVMSRKYEKAAENGVRDDILARGVINPLRIVPDGAYAHDEVYSAANRPDWPKVPALWNGQHRLAVMLEHHPDEPIPIDWGSFEEFDDAGERKNRAYNKKIPSDKPVRLAPAKKPKAPEPVEEYASKPPPKKIAAKKLVAKKALPAEGQP